MASLFEAIVYGLVIGGAGRVAVKTVKTRRAKRRAKRR